MNTRSNSDGVPGGRDAARGGGSSGGNTADTTAGVMISGAAGLAGMHAQTVRTYDPLRPGTPSRYSSRDVELLREIQRLSQEEGVNLAGIKRIIDLSNQVDALRARIGELTEELDSARSRRGGELVPVPRTSALVVWQPRRRGGRGQSGSGGQKGDRQPGSDG